MPIVESIAVIQNSGQEDSSNPPLAGYFAVALFAIVIGMIVWVIIRTSTRRSAKH
jgi:hypothetical protein